ncbi:unnamed protein product [Pedinophyceae sp. YPF-701]|nr:unnamed protein product [Pedinophyceae sp. YPF-701]
MTVKFVLMVNKQGQTRLARYTDTSMTTEEKRTLEGEIVRKCLARGEQQSNVIDHRGMKVVYRRYASLFFLMGVDADENELVVMEFAHALVEALDKFFRNVCELDIMFYLSSVHMILDEMLANGAICDTSKASVLAPLTLLASHHE